MIPRKRILNLNCAFSPRDGVQAVSYHGRPILFEGWNPAWTPDITTNEEWETYDGGVTYIPRTPPNGPYSKKHSAPVEVMIDKIMMFGSDYLDTVANKKKVWHYTDSGGWVLGTSDIGIGARILHTTFKHVIDGVEWTYFFGGQSSVNKTDPFFNELRRTSDGVTSEFVSNLPVGLADRSTAAGWSTGSAMYVASGGKYDNSGAHEYYNDMWKSVDHGVTWTQILTDSRLACMYPSRCVWKGIPVFLRGSNHTLVTSGVGNQVGMMWFDEPSTTWIDFPYNVPATHAAAVVEHNGECLVIAGNLNNYSHKFIDIGAPLAP